LTKLTAKSLLIKIRKNP